MDELALAGRVKVDNPSDDPRHIWPGDPAEPSLDVIEPGDGLPGGPEASAQEAKPGTLVECSNAPHAIPLLVEGRLARIAAGVESAVQGLVGARSSDWWFIGESPSSFRLSS
jgi:hypothetical protein